MDDDYAGHRLQAGRGEQEFEIEAESQLAAQTSLTTADKSIKVSDIEKRPVR